VRDSLHGFHREVSNFIMRFHGYQKVSPEDGLDSNMRKKPTITDRIAQLFLSPLPWVFTTFVLLIMVVVLFSQNDSVTTYDYARGFNTEYGMNSFAQSMTVFDKNRARKGFN
jgi:hypothetical protein